MRQADIIRHFLSLRKEQWLSPDEIRSIQQEKLSKILKSASKTRFYSSIKLSNDPFCDLEQIPITTKQEIQKDTSAFLTRKSKGLFEMRTSGSSGEPLKILEDAKCWDYGIALRHMNLMEMGRSPMDLLVEISHKKSHQGILQSAGLFRHRMLSIYDTEEENFGKLRKLKPDILGFYPSVISAMARMNLDGKQLKLKSVFCGAEPLSENSRKLISESFSCPVFNMYGTTEFGPIAWECPEEHSLHVNACSAYLEILDESGKPANGEGKLAITTLRNDSMPLLRYDICDRASWGKECSCGRGLPVLKTLRGRADDMIILPSGKIRSALSVNLMDDLLYLKAFQIIQEKEDLFVFRYVPAAKDITAQQKDEIKSRLIKGCLGEEILVEFQHVEKIERNKGGKLSTVVSKLSPKGI